MERGGIVRHLDSLGRIVLPKELRDRLDVRPGTSIEIFTEGDQIILRRYTPGCFFCGSMEDLREFQGRNICLSCIKKLKAEIEAEEIQGS